jgi:hypothetical protein
MKDIVLDSYFRVSITVFLNEVGIHYHINNSIYTSGDFHTIGCIEVYDSAYVIGVYKSSNPKFMKRVYSVIHHNII